MCGRSYLFAVSTFLSMDLEENKAAPSTIDFQVSKRVKLDTSLKYLCVSSATVQTLLCPLYQIGKEKISAVHWLF